MSDDFAVAGLANKLLSARSRLRALSDSPFSAGAEAVFDNTPGHVATWLRLTEERLRTGSYLGARPDHPPVETVYVEMDEFEDNADSWHAYAHACGPRLSGYPPYSWEAVAGMGLGEALTPRLNLAGMEEMQFLFDDHYNERISEPGTDAAAQVVTFAFYHLLGQAWQMERPRPLRLVANVHDHVWFAVWDPGSA